MTNKITTQGYSDSLYIWTLKFNILSSLLQIALKQSFIVLFRFNFFTLGISLFSFTYYIGFFNTNARSQHLANFIHKNVPGVYLTSTSVSWQTFQKTQFIPNQPVTLISEKNLEIPKKLLTAHLIENKLFQETTNSLGYWGDHLQVKLMPKWNSYKKQYFLGIKTPSAKKTAIQPLTSQIFVARDNLVSTDYQCLLKNKNVDSSNISVFQRNFYELDEFPLNLKQTQQQKSTQTLFGPLGQEMNTNKTQILLSNAQNPILRIGNLTLNQDSKLILNAVKNTSPAEIKMDFSKRNSFNYIQPDSSMQVYLKWKTLQEQITHFFYKKGFILDTFVRTKNNHQNWFKLNGLNSVASSQILFILNNLEQTNELEMSNFKNLTDNYENKLFMSREMSGFTYPDLTSANVLNLYKKIQYYAKFPQFHFLKHSHLNSQINIILGSHFSYPINHKEKVTVPAKLNFQYHFIRLDAPDGNLYYNGPGVLAASNKLEKLVSNFSGVKTDLQAVFDANDPRQLTLFRSFQKTPIDLKIISGTISTKKNSDTFESAKNEQYYLRIQQTKELSSEREPIHAHVDYQSEYIVPRLPNSKSWFNKTTPSIIIKTRLINSFPVKKISFITSSNFYTLFDVLDYQNSVATIRNHFLGSTEKNQKLKFYEFNQQQNALSTQLTRQTVMNIGYSKKFNPYSVNEIKTQNPNFYELQKFNITNKNQLYEPIHSNSWLMINQYLFALFIFYILRQLTKEYGRELVSYLVDLISSLGIFDESFKEELTGDGSSAGYRLITNPNKKFKDIAGVEHIFSDLSEIIWFLRNSGRSFNVGNILSKGILLIGPPGTGKTLLVQTIAGEAQVPVLVQSASALNSIEGLGAQRLQNLFEKAKQLSPCVIFFDEIDSIGQRRQHIIEDTAQTSKLIQIISSNDGVKSVLNNSLIPFTPNKRTHVNTRAENNWDSDSSTGGSSEQLGLLMQLLIELDGLQSARRVIIIGATNRPDVLDPALTRPGRLDKVFQLGLPDKEKRIEICQLYSKILGFNSNISWDYIGNQTFGLSGADLAAIVNQSAIQAILQKSNHSMETLELAIDKITGDNNVIGLMQSNAINPLESKYLPLTRFAYYYSGLAISQLILPKLKPPILCSLFPIAKNERYTRMVQKLLSSQFSWTQRLDMESELSSIYAGKILELLYLGQNTQALNMNFAQSDLGKKDLLKGTNLIYLLTNKWFLYSRNQIQDKLFYFIENKNKNEILEPQIYSFLLDLLESHPSDLMQLEQAKYSNFQRWTTKSWWQSKVSQENSVFTNVYADWYRIYVTNPDETETNDEWIPPDRYFHSNDTYLLTRTVHLNDFYKNRRDFAYKALLEKVVLSSFSELKNHSEFTDFFVMNLIQKQQLRQHEMQSIYAQFNNS